MKLYKRKQIKNNHKKMKKLKKENGKIIKMKRENKKKENIKLLINQIRLFLFESTYKVF